MDWTLEGLGAPLSDVPRRYALERDGQVVIIDRADVLAADELLHYQAERIREARAAVQAKNPTPF